MNQVRAEFNRRGVPDRFVTLIRTRVAESGKLRPMREFSWAGHTSLRSSLVTGLLRSALAPLSRLEARDRAAEGAAETWLPEGADMEQWYVSQNGKTLGPFSEERVAMLVNWGKVANDAYICDDKWSCWVLVTRSHFAPLMAARGAELRERESQAPRGLSEPPGVEGSWFGHRLALALLLTLTAAAFLLAIWLAPNPTAGPLGSAERGSGAAPWSAHSGG